MLGGGVALVAIVALVAGVADVAGMVGVVGMAAETGRSETQKGMLRLSRGSEAAWLNAGPTLNRKTLPTECMGRLIPLKSSAG